MKEGIETHHMSYAISATVEQPYDAVVRALDSLTINADR
jgi:hypothetical protein